MAQGNLYLVWKEITNDGSLPLEYEGDVEFVACFKDEEQLKSLPDGEYVVQIGKRAKPDKVPSDWTRRRRKLTVATETRVD